MWEFDLIWYRITEYLKYFIANLTTEKCVFLFVVVFGFDLCMYRITARKKDFWYWTICSVYELFLLSITLFGRRTVERTISMESLLSTYYWLQNDFYHAKFDVLFNILLFIPAGVLLIFKFSWRRSLLLVLLTTVVIEAMQFVFALGQFEIFDLIDNTLGGMIGIGIVVVVSKIKNQILQ